MTGLIFILVMFLLLWLLLIQPQRRRQRQAEAIRQSVKPGDEILTVAGIYGTVTGEGPDGELRVEIAPGTEIRLDRRAVATIVSAAEAPGEPDRGYAEPNP